ncbi:MAG TPA: GAF domain-containing protein [Thermomicrobiales bacterium]|nr:GAF domain-containing protein [Thermomicrobiales bacterium]
MTGNRVEDLERELAEERRARQALVETSVRLNSLLNLPELLQTIMASAADLLGAETSSLMLLDEETNELTFEVATGEAGQEVKQLRVPADQGIAGWVLQHREPAVVGDVASDPRFYGQIDQSSGFQTRSMLAVPLSIRDRTIGVVEVINKQGSEQFDARDQDIATALAAQAAVAIDNARLYQKLADALVESRMSYRL